MDPFAASRGTNPAEEGAYIRRPLNAHDDMVAPWASGDAFEPSIAELFFSDRMGNVYKPPYDMTDDFAKPILVRAAPEPATLGLLAILVLARRPGRRGDAARIQRRG